MIIDCHTSQEWMTSYLARGLSKSDTYAMERHLRGCKECAHEMRELKPMFHYLTVSMDVSQTESDTLSDTRMQVLLDAADDQAISSSTTPFTRVARHLAVWGSMAASILLGSYLGMQSGQEKIQRDEVTIEISSSLINLASNSDTEISNPENNTGAISLVGYESLPEYGLGFNIQPQDTGTINLMHPYFGLPGPRPQHLYSPGYAMDLHQ